MRRLSPAAALLTLAFALGGCAGVSVAEDSAEPASSPTAEDVADTETASAETKAPTKTEEPVAEQGTRKNPFPAGSELVGSGAGGDEASIVIGAANWDAGAIIVEENQFNDPPPDGATYVMVPVTIKNVGSEDAVVPWIAFTVKYVAADGRSFDEASVVIPGELMDVGDLYEGGVGEGNMAFAIPTDAQGEGGQWAVEYGWSDPVFIEVN